jgi:photosystem II stability/assembly factor-like uncharacterized protein
VKTHLFVATGHGLLDLVRDGNRWKQDGGGLEHRAVTSIASQANALLAGTRAGIYRSDDLGQTWWEANDGLAHRYVRWLAFHPDEPGLAFAGTEPAAVFVSEDGGRSWRERPEVASLRDDGDWSLPYSPAAGCVRGFAFHGQRGYAAVEQGGLLRSEDRGRTWHLVEGTTGTPHAVLPESYVHSDVHSVTVHPSSADQIFAATGGGLFYSSDGGSRWTRIRSRYCRAVWVDPVRPGHLIAGPADWVDRNGRIEESINGGQTWEQLDSGITSPWPSHMVERFLQVDGELLAVLSNGELLSTSLDTLSWRTVLAPVTDVRAATAVTA